MLLVVVDRKIRKTFLKKILPVSIQNVHEALTETKEKYVGMKTLTLDNDILFKRHIELTGLLDVKIYFCNPYHSWEKGTVENRNRAVRRYVPKKTNLASIPRERFAEVEKILRTRYMKCLTFKTPQEAWDCEIERV